MQILVDLPRANVGALLPLAKMVRRSDAGRAAAGRPETAG